MTEIKAHKSNYFLIIITLIIFIISLFETMYFVDVEGGNSGGSGIMGLLLGWVFVPSLKGIVWLANPLLFSSIFLLLIKSPKKAKITGLIAILFGLTFLFWDEVPIDEGGTEKNIISYGFGYYIWILSLIINFIGQFITDFIHSEN